jgi:small-conductance mechanosensitive channel
MRSFLDSPIALWDGLEGLTQLADDEKDGWQWAIVGGALLLGFLLSLLMARTIFATGTRSRGACERFFKPTRKFGGVPLSAALLLWLAYVCGQNEFGGDREVLHTAALLATGFAVYRLAVALSKDQWVPRMIGIAALITIGLHLVGVLDSFLFSLQNYHLPLGDLRINPWAIFSGVLALFLLLWLANLSSRFLDAGLHAQGGIPGSMRVLIAKLARFIFYVVAVLIALKIGGFNLGALTVFSGALGLGIGFGLQKVVSNLVSGVIILLDKSIKPGDVIEIENAYGSINSLRTRYVSVITRDRKEYLIPNEDFITSPVINWSFTGKEIRIRMDVGVAYGTDLRKAIALCVEAAEAEDRVLKNPESKCLLLGFGDSSIDLQLRVWINDAHNGVSNIKSAVLLGVWDRFEEAGIEIPFPQVDLNVKSDQRKQS